MCHARRSHCPGVRHNGTEPPSSDGYRPDMDAAELDYELPPALVAQRPPARRGDSRLLVYDRASGAVRHRRFAELPDELRRRELVVVNDTRVVPARIPISSPRGEVLLLERLAGDVWEGLARPTRRLRPGPRYGPVARDAPRTGRTELFITPGFEFRRVDSLLTNFHLPRSTLLALVMAFAGIEQVRSLYELAIEEQYRFYSFGDAMLIL